MCRALIYILVMLVLASSPAITNAQTKDIYAKEFNCGKKFVTFAAMRKDLTWSQWTLRKSDIMAIDKDMDPDPKTRRYDGNHHKIDSGWSLCLFRRCEPYC